MTEDQLVTTDREPVWPQRQHHDVCGNREFVGRLTTNWGPIDGFRPANTGLEG
jgi:hypothetical protein